MEQQKIVFVSHCALNTAAKVQAFGTGGRAGGKTAQGILHRVVDQGIQIDSAALPEFTLYGASRWGHVKEQFDNPFFRDHCRKILQPIIQQMKGYLQPREQEKSFRCWAWSVSMEARAAGLNSPALLHGEGVFSHNDLPQLLRMSAVCRNVVY